MVNDFRPFGAAMAKLSTRSKTIERADGSEIVGRGTRVHEETKKFYFTIMDFRGATNHFADPDFDGEPVQNYEPHDDDPITPPDDVPPSGDDGEPIPPEPGEDEVIVDGPPLELIRPFGNLAGFQNAVHQLQSALYAGAG